LSGNEALGGAGGAGGNGGAASGGGLFIGGVAGATVSLDYVAITGNQATGGAASVGGQNGQGIGGGVFILNSIVIVRGRHMSITGNHASTSNDDVFGNLDDGG
jgi:hypothetical protein